MDHVASMVAYQQGQAGRSRVTKKCWEFFDAYKQIPFSDQACEKDAYLSVFNSETRAPSIFKQRVLPFRSIASATALLRVSFALWAIGNRLLELMWSAHLDDFLSLSEAASAKCADMCVASLFSFLGWRLSEDKLVPFSSVCKASGVWPSTPTRREELRSSLLT